MKITWDNQACCHSANCVKALPEVFVVEETGLAIYSDKADQAEVMKVVNACPGKAFSVVED